MCTFCSAHGQETGGPVSNGIRTLCLLELVPDEILFWRHNPRKLNLPPNVLAWAHAAKSKPVSGIPRAKWTSDHPCRLREGSSKVKASLYGLPPHLNSTRVAVPGSQLACFFSHGQTPHGTVPPTSQWLGLGWLLNAMGSPGAKCPHAELAGGLESCLLF